MDSNVDEFEKDLLSNPNKLLEHLGDRIEEIERILDDDENFCDKDIDSTIQYAQTIEGKFHEKIEELKVKLEQIRLENKTTSEKNKEQYNDQMQEINDLFSSGRHSEAWKKFKDYEKIFEQRSVLIDRIPKLHATESDIEQIFSSEKKPAIQSTVVTTPAVTTITSADDKLDSTDDIIPTTKERLRKEKVIEKIVVGKNDEDVNEVNDEKQNEQENNKSLFGIRSKHAENPQPTINGTIRQDAKSPLSTVASRPIRFSTRLGPAPSNKSLPFSGRDISVRSSIINNSPTSRDNHGQVRSTPTPPHSICLSNQGQLTSIKDGKFESIFLNPVSLYQHDPNKFLLMTFNHQYIIIFRSQLSRLDRWDFGAIERGSHTAQSFDWHDGLIISMGYIRSNTIYMFTEREFFLYSMSNPRKLDTRILARGNDDGSETSSHPYEEPQRGIGTVHDKYIYHIYLNRNSNWTLTKFSLDKLAHMGDLDLTRRLPEVHRFIHICVNDETINFLVQMNDSSYAVIFCSLNDCTPYNTIPPITLCKAQHPLTIYSAYIKPLKKYFFFINDPSIKSLHILTHKEYLQSYSVYAHAICYVADSQELMVVTNNSICSINLHEQNLSFS